VLDERADFPRAGIEQGASKKKKPSALATETTENIGAATLSRQ
jgi:hypothetical protein